MAESPREWFIQAEYDLDTARAMFDSGRNVYAVYMCHLSMEKALKGLYQEKYEKIPPKTHDLRYLLEKIGLRPSETQEKFLIRLNSAGVTTRYPEELSKLFKIYPEDIVRDYLASTKELVAWAAQQLRTP
ncbi:MAG: HEPN domain-containing protein [Candidatus Hydrogenedentes bacterium]|nr:HEPN domain-containing protein [Candidatus Hydrogenedentota bacterium]